MMESTYKTLEEARDGAFQKHLSLRMSLKRTIGWSYSNLGGQHLGTYIFRTNEGFRFRNRPVPFDLENGHLVNPDAGMWTGQSATLGRDQIPGIAALAVTLISGWRQAEIGYKTVFQGWARMLNIPVYVQVANMKYPWYQIYWEHTENGCRSINRETREVQQCATQTGDNDL